MAKTIYCEEHTGVAFAPVAGRGKKCGHETFGGFHYCKECATKKKRCPCCGVKIKNKEGE